MTNLKLIREVTRDEMVAFETIKLTKVSFQTYRLGIFSFLPGFFRLAFQLLIAVQTSFLIGAWQLESSTTNPY